MCDGIPLDDDTTSGGGTGNLKGRGNNELHNQQQQQNQKRDTVSKSSTSSSNKVITTWEIIGDIKSTPHDFIVREIGWIPPPPKKSTEGKDTSDEQPQPQQLHEQRQKEDEEEEEKSHSMLKSDDRSYMNKYTKRKGWLRGIAGLVANDSDTSTEANNECFEKMDSPRRNDERITFASKRRTNNSTVIEQDLNVKSSTSDMPTEKEMKSTQIEAGNSTGVDSATEELLDAPASSTLTTTTQPPVQILRQILMQCFDDSNEMITGPNSSVYADSIMCQLASLQNKAYDQIKESTLNIVASEAATKALQKENISDDFLEPLDHDDTNTVWISTSNLFKDDINKRSWKLLHQTLRQVYPLLKTENSSQPSVSREDTNSTLNVTKKNQQSKKKSNNKNAWVCALVDDCFFSLIPYLLHPADDLLQLYKFRSFGPVSAVTVEEGSRSNQVNNRKKNRWKKGKKEKQNHNEDKDEKAREGGDKLTESNRGKVLLRLRPELPRTERRNIHLIITGKNTRNSNDFETSTRNDIPVNDIAGVIDNTPSMTTTSAIVVQWSRMALQNSQKKRKRNEWDSTQSDINALFCTLKKEQVEHQVAIQSLMRALKCRPGDIGLAGIKDMKAITYQYCTLRNVDLKRAQRPIMDKRVSLSNFVQVKNFLLDRGRLIGNQFEITLRNLRQVEQLMEEENEFAMPPSWKERAVSLRLSHLEAMVKRVSAHGFINYYGEQRVGDAGHRDYVGVRSFDVGRALLQSKFSLAVDLIMEGRSTNVYNPTEEEITARQTWKTTRDARATLKEFPKNRNMMVRERDLMRGLLRYGDAFEAVRAIPHSAKTFWVHAYQSLVWNIVATERVRRFGVNPIVGDLYLNDNERNVQVVSDPSSVDFSQVILPLPGYTIQYPLNEIGHLYSDILRADGVEFSAKNDTDEVTAKGSYRKLIGKASNLKWEVVADNDDEIKKSSSSETDPVVDAARFTFELDSGCYATMMLRELMVMTMARGNGHDRGPNLSLGALSTI